jgi:hypothetical protein
VRLNGAGVACSAVPLHAAASAFKLPFLAEPTKLIERWQQLRDLINATEASAHGAPHSLQLRLLTACTIPFFADELR